MTERFSEPVLRVLEAAGWFDGREVDITSAEETLRRWGFEVSPAARAILREFLGLECVDLDTRSWLSFRFDTPIMEWEPGDVPAIGRLTGESLCPVGFGCGMIWLVAASGHVVLLNDQWLGFTRACPFLEALDAHFRAQYEAGEWVDLTDERLRELLGEDG